MSADYELSANGKVFKKYRGTASEFAVPDGVKTIGIEAFRNCSTLKSVVIPEGVKTIDWGAFFGCKSLESVETPNGVTTIANAAFCGCRALKSIVVPNGVKTVWNKAFYDCSSLTSIALPESLKIVGEDAFAYCRSLTSVDLPESVNKIDFGAFRNCSSLTAVFIPKRVKTIGVGAFSGCRALKSFEVDENNSRYRSVDGVLFSKNGRTLVKIPGATALETFFVSEEINKVRFDAFDACRSIKTIDVAENNSKYRSVDGVLFSKDGKKLVAFPEGMQKDRYLIDDEVKTAFLNCCPLLESIDVAENNSKYRSIDGVLFSKDGKKLVKFPGGMKKERYVVPESVAEIEPGAFSGCVALTSITVSKNVELINYGAFENCVSLESVVVEESVESLGPSAFAGCSALKSVVLPKSVEQFSGWSYWDEDGEFCELDFTGDDVFLGCKAMTIRAPKGSPAERYAKECQINFEPSE